MYRGICHSSAEKYSSLHEYLRYRLCAHINAYCMTYICDIPIIPCIHLSINIAYYILELELCSTGLQVYSQMSTDAVYRSVYLYYTASVQRYTGIQVYTSTGIRSAYIISIQSGSRMQYTVYSVYRVYRW